MMQERNLIPAPLPGTAVTTILLTSPASSIYNNRPGIVVTPTSTIKPGRICVLLDGKTNALSFKLKKFYLASFIKDSNGKNGQDRMDRIVTFFPRVLLALGMIKMSEVDSLGC